MSKATVKKAQQRITREEAAVFQAKWAAATETRDRMLNEALDRAEQAIFKRSNRE